jgi:PfaD family protein
MANGIASADLVEAMSRAGMLAFFGAAGLPLHAVEAACQRLAHGLGDRPHGFNLIHSPSEPALENAVVDLYLRRGVRLVEASAYLDLTLPVVRYRLHGIRLDPQGQVVTPNRVIAKVSRVEVASKFFAPPPERLVQELVRQGHLTAGQARLAARVPVAQDLTAEADSAGHTDNRPAVTLLPTLLALRDRLQARYAFDQPLRVGAAGGIATPASAAAAFVMGAAYVLTGSVNQACAESGSSDAVREMLAQAEQADTAMAPAADMFEMGVKVQVLKRGTMFAMRAAKLYELYRAYPGLDALPTAERTPLEKNLFRAPVEEVWAQTRTYFLGRDPSQVARADADPKHKMALVFRWYLGQSSRWANAGEPARKVDYQVWCGPAMGAFNEWVRGSFLEAPRNRRVVPVALNILYGAAVLLRLHTLRSQGVRLPPDWSHLSPLEPERLAERMKEEG